MSREDCLALIASLESDAEASMRAAKYEIDREEKALLRAEAGGIRIAIGKLRSAMERAAASLDGAS